MPVITCPKCQGKLRFPDDSPARRVKCPTCGNVFMSTDGIDPKDPTVRATDRPDLPKARDSRGEFDLPMDDDRRSRRRDDDDDDRRSRRRDEDDDRRSRRRDDDDDRDRRRDDDDDYDRGRRSRSRDDDDDDYDRRRRGRRRDERDDYDDRGRRKKQDARAYEGQMNRTSLACLLNFIAGWLQVGAFGLVAFIIFLDWCGIREGLRIFSVIAGLLGLGYWLTSATGFGFLVSGPRTRGALGLSIATAACAGLHLMLIIVIATSRAHGGFGNPMGDRTAEVHWDSFVTQIRALPVLLFFEIGVGDFYRYVSEGSLLPVVTNFAEIARMVLFLLTLRAVMLTARDNKTASLCMKTVIGFACGSGGLILVGILFGVLLLAVRPTAPTRTGSEGASAVIHLFFLVMYLVLAGLSVGIALVVKSVKSRIDYR